MLGRNLTNTMRDFSGKTAIVTGAASGIGRGIARAFAAEGMSIVLADIDPDALALAQRDIEQRGARTIAVVADVSDAASVEQVAREAEAAFGKVHVAVNNAGVAFHGTPLDKIALRDWDWVIGVNVYGVIHGIRTFLPLIRKHGEGGYIVNTASTAGFRVSPGLHHGLYAMTKHAVVALTEALQQELSDTNIAVSMLCPGAVDTDLDASSRHRPDRFGGGFVKAEHQFMRGFMAGGLSPSWVGDRLLQGMKAGEFVIFTNSDPRRWIEERHRLVSDAFDRVQAIEATLPKR
jgi:NAD(P)-dependent dehydrogenase (short-subunit alcohol dehydrogenase family)